LIEIKLFIKFNIVGDVGNEDNVGSGDNLDSYSNDVTKDNNDDTNKDNDTRNHRNLHGYQQLVLQNWFDIRAITQKLQSK